MRYDVYRKLTFKLQLTSFKKQNTQEPLFSKKKISLPRYSYSRFNYIYFKLAYALKLFDLNILKWFLTISMKTLGYLKGKQCVSVDKGISI